MPHDDDLHESPLPPADDERIRRLLAESRHTEPIPDAVAARLDGVLADLVADRSGRDAAQPEPRGQAAPVVDLAARRRRTAANLLVAAAAVVAVGVGISQVLPQGSDGDATTAEVPAADDAQQPEAEAGGSGGALEEAPTDGASVKVRSKRFGADVRKVQLQVQRGVLPDTASPEFLSDQGCVPADVGAGDLVPATYDGAPAVVVLRIPSGDVQVVDLYLCGDTDPRRSITLTMP